MSFVRHLQGGETVYVEEEKFHRRELRPGEELRVAAKNKPVAVWLPSNYEIVITSEQGAVLDVSEVVEHHDLVSMDSKLQRMARDKRRAERKERQARRRLRGVQRMGTDSLP